VAAIVERELRALHRRARHHALRPLLAEVRREAERLRLAGLEEACAGGSLDREAADRLTRELVDRVVAAAGAVLHRGDGPAGNGARDGDGAVA
jgi:glutamyl-tRNA reductase